MDLGVERGGEGKTTTHTRLPAFSDSPAEIPSKEIVMKYEPVVDPVIID